MLSFGATLRTSLEVDSILWRKKSHSYPADTPLEKVRQQVAKAEFDVGLRHEDMC